MIYLVLCGLLLHVREDLSKFPGLSEGAGTFRFVCV